MQLMIEKQLNRLSHLMNNITRINRFVHLVLVKVNWNEGIF